MLPLQKCLTMAAPSKQFVAPAMEKLRKAESSVYPGSPDTCVAFSPAALEAKEGAFWALEEGDGSRIHWGHHLPRSLEGQSRLMCQRPGDWVWGKREPALHEVPHPNSLRGEAQ